MLFFSQNSEWLQDEQLIHKRIRWMIKKKNIGFFGTMQQAKPVVIIYLSMMSIYMSTMLIRHGWNTELCSPHNFVYERNWGSFSQTTYWTIGLSCSISKPLTLWYVVSRYMTVPTKHIIEVCSDIQIIEKGEVIFIYLI